MQKLPAVDRMWKLVGGMGMEIGMGWECEDVGMRVSGCTDQRPLQRV